MLLKGFKDTLMNLHFWKQNENKSLPIPEEINLN